MLKFNKGDLVEVQSIVKAEYKVNKKVLVSHPQKFTGIVVGYSKIVTGIYDSGYGEQPSSLDNIKWHKVVKVIPLHTNQYIKPYNCFEYELKSLPTPFKELETGLLKIKSAIETNPVTGDKTVQSILKELMKNR